MRDDLYSSLPVSRRSLPAFYVRIIVEEIPEYINKAYTWSRNLCRIVHEDPGESVHYIGDGPVDGDVIAAYLGRSYSERLSVVPIERKEPPVNETPTSII